MKSIIVNGKEYLIIKLIGKGKGGYSYLASFNDSFVVVKQIHHEPCDYYKFGNKIEAELNDYKRLCSLNIRIPKMLDYDTQQEVIIKEYIEGKTVFEMVRDDEDVSSYISQVRSMGESSRNAGLNIDYFPTNFVAKNGLIYYIDYECNNYMDEWNFDNWGIKYWSKTPEFMEYLKSQI